MELSSQEPDTIQASVKSEEMLWYPCGYFLGYGTDHNPTRGIRGTSILVLNIDILKMRVPEEVPHCN